MSPDRKSLMTTPAARGVLLAATLAVWLVPAAHGASSRDLAVPGLLP